MVARLPAAGAMLNTVPWVWGLQPPPMVAENTTVASSPAACTAAVAAAWVLPITLGTVVTGGVKVAPTPSVRGMTPDVLKDMPAVQTVPSGPVATAFRWFPEVPLGLATWAQLLPSQCSRRVGLEAPPVLYPPTAQALPGDTALTADRVVWLRLCPGWGRRVPGPIRRR